MSKDPDLPPIVRRLSPSPEQEPAILARGRDVVVTAGAGTGKTRTLVARYLALLAEQVQPRAILAITFTQKAAREMRNRVREAVRGYLAQPDLTDEDRRFWQSIYSRLDAARISTIHSFCTELLRAHPAEAGIDPRFEVLDDAQASLLRTQAVQEALAWAADDATLVWLFGLLGEGDLEATLSTLVQQRLDVGPIFTTTSDDLLTTWTTTLIERQARTLSDLLSDDSWQTCLACLEANAAAQANDVMEQNRRLVLENLLSPGQTFEACLAALDCLDTFDLRGGSGKNWPGGKDQLDEVKAALKTLKKLRSDRIVFLTLKPTDHDRQMTEVVPVLQQLFNYAQARYNRLKQERSALDFDDLEAGALQLLNEHAAIRLTWQQTIEALLVDEFQDTNARQRDLLAHLNGDGGKLFIVGDAKQSIYRFRGADVTVFRTERRQIEVGGGVHVALNTSYRAHEALLVGMNALLEPVLGRTAPPTQPWREPFGALKPHRLQPGRGFELPHIELQLAIGSKSAGALDRAADGVVQGLIHLVETTKAEVGVGSYVRRLTYGDIAILCRSSTSFAPYEDALERAGVPFLTVAGRGFYGRAEIRDVLNALQAIADPSDDLALSGLLRSPAMGLSDESLYQLHLARGGKDVSLWAVLSAGTADLSPADRSQAGRAVRLMAGWHAQVGRTTIADLLKNFLDQTDYRAALIRAGEQRRARNIAKLLADAHASGIVGVGEFLAYVGSLRDSGTREGEARATAEGAVQLMTVHAAKGLEFPIVVLGDITYRSPRRDELLFDPTLSLLLPLKDEAKNLSIGYELGKMTASDQEAAESDRLLYVAATRAQEKLILSGCVAINRDGSPARMAGWLQRLVETALPDLADTSLTGEADSTSQRFHLQIGQTPIGCLIYGDAPASGQSNRQAEIEPEWPTPLPPPLLAPIQSDAGPGQPVHQIWRVTPIQNVNQAPGWLIGKLVHTALSHWRFPDGDFDRWATAFSQNEGLIDEAQISHALSSARRSLVHFQAQPLYSRLEHAARRLHEVPYSLSLKGQIENGVIDLIFLEAGRWWIVEFKTDYVPDNTHLEDLLNKSGYLAQLERYQLAGQKLLGQVPQVLLCWLNYQDNMLVQTEDQLRMRLIN